ncbi:ComEC/Rec2 family competence protein [Tenacibaculum crassostreae]|uniref:ComEC/Rec2 family competence protein n=1 Tax=Tenacibaculum crassostreae TaxID=502683 RepID=UPI0038936100
MKKLVSYTPILFLVFLILGIMLQFYQSIWKYSFPIFFLILVVTIFVLFILKLKSLKVWFSIIVAFVFILIGIAAVFIQNPKNYSNYYFKNYQPNETIVITIHQILKPGNYYTKYIAKVTQVNNIKTTGNVLVNIKKDSGSFPLKVNQQFILKPEFKELIPPLNPHQFNYKEYLAKQHIYHQLFLNNSELKQVDNASFSLIGLSASVRNNIQQSLQKHNFSKDEYAVINALLLGQRQEISKELLDDYTNAGAIHILAISGLHIGIILLLLSYLLKPLEKLPKGILIKTLSIILLLWSFAFIAGLSASVVRAVTMFTFIAIGQSFKRKKVIEFSLVSSLFFLLLINPLFLFDVGFQLSYLAVFGIVWTQPLLYNLWNTKNFLLDKLWRLLTVSVAAQAGILPISLYYFHQFPSLFILSNLVIIPFLGGILLFGIIIIFLALLNILPQFLADGYQFIISLMNSFVGWISHQESFLLQEISMSLLAMFFWYVVIVLFFQVWIHKSTKRIFYFLGTVVLLQGVYLFEKFERENKKEFLVFHKSRNSIIGIRKGKELQIYNSKDTIINEKLFQSYRIGENVNTVVIDSTFNYTTFKNKQLLIIDSLGIYQLNKLQNSIIILQHNPKINLNRLIATIQPQQIIADGSNYKSYINKWQETSYKQKTPFWYTGQNGVFIIK